MARFASIKRRRFLFFCARTAIFACLCGTQAMGAEREQGVLEIRIKDHREAIVGSKSGYYISHLLTKVDPLLPAGVKDTIEPYVAELDGAAPPGGEPTLPEKLTEQIFDTAEERLTEKLNTLWGKGEAAVENAHSEVQNAWDQPSFAPPVQDDDDDLEMVDVAPPTGRR